MAYIKNEWKDQEVERPRTYQMTNNADGSVTLIDDFGIVTELGTPVNADYMNHIEDGIEDHEERITVLEGKKTDLDLINQSKALTTGNVSSNPDVYADVLKRAHSTFDKSKFEVVGSPTITDDGVASEFSTSNNITIQNLSIDTTKYFYISLKYRHKLAPESNQCIIAFNIPTFNIQFGVPTTNKLRFAIYTGTTLQIESNTVLSEDTEYLLGLELKNNNFNLYINNVLEKTAKKTSDFSCDNLYIGCDNTKGANVQGSIDLKSIVVYDADGVPVFNGNITGTDTIDDIEIPYTLSNNGSKIVDVAYRDKVQELYTKTGEALYYTLDEQNQDFTLPAGDIYGMITKKMSNDFSNATENGKTNVKNLIYPDFSNVVDLPKTKDLVQQADKDCYLYLFSASRNDAAIEACTAEGDKLCNLIACDTTDNVAIGGITPLIPKGTYFKISYLVGTIETFKKIYTIGGN